MSKTKLLLGFALLTLSFGSCKNKNNPAITTNTPVTVNVYNVSNDSLLSNIHLSGNIDAHTTVKLGFMVAGRIQQFGFNEGDRIGKGQLLAQIEMTNYQIAKDLAQVQVNQVQDEYNRIKILFDRNSVSESDFKKVEYTLENAKNQLRLHEKNLNDTRLYSTINGIVLKKLSEVGEIVSTGYPVAVIADISKVNVLAYIPESQIGSVKIGSKATVNVTALDQTFEGIVKEIAAAADVTTRAFTAKVEVKNENMVLKPGMLADVTLQNSVRKEVLAIPLTSIIRTSEGQAYVYLIDSSKQQAFQRNISLGAIIEDKIEVLSGLSAGDIIVNGGQQKLVNGTAISIAQN